MRFLQYCNCNPSLYISKINRGYLLQCSQCSDSHWLTVDDCHLTWSPSTLPLLRVSRSLDLDPVVTGDRNRSRRPTEYYNFFLFQESPPNFCYTDICMGVWTYNISRIGRRNWLKRITVNNILSSKTRSIIPEEKEKWNNEFNWKSRICTYVYDPGWSRIDISWCCVESNTMYASLYWGLVHNLNVIPKRFMWITYLWNTLRSIVKLSVFSTDFNLLPPFYMINIMDVSIFITWVNLTSKGSSLYNDPFQKVISSRNFYPIPEQVDLTQYTRDRLAFPGKMKLPLVPNWKRL